jgi:exopolysaccharide biosynthesis protein
LKLGLLMGVLAFVGAFLFTSQSGQSHKAPRLEVVEIKLGPSVRVRPIVAREGSEIGAAFSSVIEKQRPYAAINGTYYDIDMRPLGDILVDGKLANRGIYRNGVGVSSSGRILFLHKKHGRLNWSGCRNGIAAGPRLIHNGQIALDPVADGFSKKSLTKQALRSGIGKTKDGKLLLAASKDELTLGEFARAMRELGAVEAMNLDGGGASGLYCDGKMLAKPSLPMSNMLLIYK